MVWGDITSWVEHLPDFCAAIVAKEAMFIWVVHTHVVLFHRQQHEEHELLVAVLAWLHLWAGLDGKVHEEEVLEDSLFLPFGVLLGPVIDPLFDLVLAHVLLGVDVIGSDCDGQAALFVEPGAEALELHVASKRLEFVDIVFHLLRSLGLLHVLDLGDEGRGGLVQEVCVGG